MADWWYIDNSTLQAQITEAIIQAVFWSITLSTVRYYLRNVINNAQYFKYVSSHEGGADELVCWLTCVPQHTISVLLLWYGITFHRNDIFRSAVLAEFGYEVYDLLTFYINHFLFSKNKTAKEKENALLGLKAVTLHHLPGILVIIPSVHLFGTDPYFQNVVWSLLSYTPIWVILIAAYKCCNINDLNGRTQFTVYYTMSLIITICGRFIWCPFAMYRFIVNTFMEQTLVMQCALIFYAILIYGFNLLVLIVSVTRLNKYMFGTKNKELENVKATKMLQRYSSDKILADFVDKAWDFDLFGNQQLPHKPKYKRHYSEPIFN